MLSDAQPLDITMLTPFFGQFQLTALGAMLSRMVCKVRKVPAPTAKACCPNRVCMLSRWERAESDRGNDPQEYGTWRSPLFTTWRSTLREPKVAVGSRKRRRSLSRAIRHCAGKAATVGGQLSPYISVACMQVRPLASPPEGHTSRQKLGKLDGSCQPPSPCEKTVKKEKQALTNR